MAIKGVNLGGWLALERWITPSLFTDMTAKDEYSFCGQANVTDFERLRQHHQDWVTLADFEWLAAHGLEAVRIGVGYWIFGDEPPFVGSIEKLDEAFAWADQTGLKILIDLHGAPGSQNGWDHSGRAGELHWPNGSNIEKSLAILRRLAERYEHQPALLGLELLNEPRWDLPHELLVSYYETAYHDVRPILGPNRWIVFSDAFRPFDWAKSLPAKHYDQLYQDNHHFQVFGDDDKKMSYKRHVRRAEQELPDELDKMQRHHPVVVGEWSVALSDQSLQGLAGDRLGALRQQFASAQLQAYAATAGWFFWTYKTEDRGAWNFRAGVDDGWLPKAF